jgi:hypothetical protein
MAASFAVNVARSVCKTSRICKLGSADEEADADAYSDEYSEDEDDEYKPKAPAVVEEQLLHL